MTQLKLWLKETAVWQPLVLFLVMRLFLSAWAIVALTINPTPAEPDERIRPYLGQPILTEGATGLLLGPWQRFDTQRYLLIAQEGYADEKNSVFPPLYPLLVRGMGTLLGGGAVAYLTAGILLSNLACLGLLLLLYRVVSAEVGPDHALRTLVYLVLFPTGFFLFAPYTESLFILLALASVWAARNGRFGLAGTLGFLAALTRLTGWILIVPLAYEFWRQRVQPSDQPWFRFLIQPSLWAVLLPPLGFVSFVIWRWGAGLSPLPVIYEQYWYQTTGFPGQDVLTAVDTLFFNGSIRANELISLSLDFAVTIFLFITTILVFRRFGLTYGLYGAMLLFFILLPTSDFKPLYSFSRYALTFFPTFMWLGVVGQRPFVNRLILYPSVVLYLFFSGQFFMWGWVA